MKYTEYKGLNLPNIGEEMRKFWEEHDVFAKSLSTRIQNAINIREFQ